MFESLIRITTIVGASVLWFAGLRLFLQSDVPRVRKVGWTAVLVLVGIGIGIVLPLGQVWARFLLLMVLLPLLGLADVLLLRSGRGLSFWIRACGFEVCTVFAVAAILRLLLDRMGAEALLESPHNAMRCGGFSACAYSIAFRSWWQISPNGA